MIKSESLSRDGAGYFLLGELAVACGGAVMAFGRSTDGRERIAEIVIDSRSVRSGDLFVALSGNREDGERYASDAFENGAVAVLCRRGGAVRIGVDGVYIEVEDPLTALVEAARRVRRGRGATVIGVTGSVGKTTVKELCLRVLSQTCSVDGTQGNHNNLLGLSLSMLNAFGVEKMKETHGKSSENTPEYLVLEMGISHAGEMDELAEIALPDVAVITNVGDMHAEHLGDRKAIAAEKCRILAYGAKKLICPCDPLILEEASRYVDKKATVALSMETDVLREDRSGCSVATLKRYGSLWREFAVCLTDGTGKMREWGRFTAPIMGMHGITDSALAVLLGIELGVENGKIAAGLSEYSPAPMRQELICDGGIYRIVDCYNSGPASARAALSAMAEYARIYGCGRRIAVLGDMLELGEKAPFEHYSLGEALTGYGVDLLFTVGEMARGIAQGALGNGMDPSRVISYGGDASYGIIKKEIELTLRRGDIILYKASRGLGLERLL